MRKLKFILLFTLIPVLSFAQKVMLKGEVKDAYGEPIIGANVLLKGSVLGAMTDFDGIFNIEVPEGIETVLVINYLGYKTKEVEAKKGETLHVVLEVDAQDLDEVVVTALGIKREKKSLTYASQTVNVDDISEVRSSNFLNNLAGKAAGVQIISSGSPTGTNRVVIRGATSVTGDNQPLYVVDGIELISEQGDADLEANTGGIDYGNPISQINPDDIESIEVLKGANAAALYGSRAANGVVLITTKSGSSTNGIGASVNYNMMFSEVLQYPDFQYAYGPGNGGTISNRGSAAEDGTVLPLATNTRAYGEPLMGQRVIGPNGEETTYVARPNNIKELYQVGLVQSRNIGLQGGNDKGTFRLSFTNLVGDHVLKNLERQKRNTVSLNTSYKFTDKFQARTNLIYTNDQVENRVYQNGSNRNPANSYIFMLPSFSKENMLPYKDANGVAFDYPGAYINPYWNIYENSNDDENNRLLGSLDFIYSISRAIRLSIRATSVISDRVRNEFNNTGANYDPDGFYRTLRSTSRNARLRAMLSYNKRFNKFSINSNLGAETFFNKSNSVMVTLDQLYVPNLKSLTNNAGVPTIGESDPIEKIRSIYGSLSLGYNKTIFLEATARNDWSSTLPDDNNSFFYPSIGSSFVFTELLPKSDVFSYGKLRFSYAEVGSATRPFRLLNGFNNNGVYNGIPYLSLQNRSNNINLKPELTSSYEAGFESFFFNTRLKFDATVYKSSTVNQIIPVQLSRASGFNDYWVNAGEIANKGIELLMQATIVKGNQNGFNWDVIANWSTNRSEVVSLLDGIDRLRLRNVFNVNVFAEVGKPLGVLTGQVAAVDKETGLTLVNQGGRILRENDVEIGNAQPLWIGGLRNSFRYKNISFSFLLDAKYGGDLYSGSVVRAVNNGLHTSTLPGREEWFLSSVLGENNNERRGIGLDGQPYADTREIGLYHKNAAIGETNENGEFVAAKNDDGSPQEVTRYLSPLHYHLDRSFDQRNMVYDASFVKLREINLGYSFPNETVEKLGLQSLKISAVARNLWFIWQNTPEGIDPEASSTSGNGQGVEVAAQLPTFNYGFNVNVTF